jgi:hypothetical protein
MLGSLKPTLKEISNGKRLLEQRIIMMNYIQSNRRQMEDTYWQVTQRLSARGQKMLGSLKPTLKEISNGTRLLEDNRLIGHIQSSKPQTGDTYWQVVQKLPPRGYMMLGSLEPTLKEISNGKRPLQEN